MDISNMLYLACSPVTSEPVVLTFNGGNSVCVGWNNRGQCGGLPNKWAIWDYGLYISCSPLLPGVPTFTVIIQITSTLLSVTRQT